MRDGLFAIGYGIPPNGPLRAIRRATPRLARTIATYLRASGREAAVNSATSPE